MCPRWVEYVSVLRQAYSKNSRPDNEKFVTKRFLFLWAAGKPRQTCQNDEDIGQRMLMFYIELRGHLAILLVLSNEIVHSARQEDHDLTCPCPRMIHL